MRRREFLGAVSAAGGAVAVSGCKSVTHKRRPNVVYVFTDQWRASATGYAGDPNVKTPNLDALAAESFNFKNAVSVCPVCSPARASMITGQYPLTHGVFVNDVCLKHDAPSIADCFNEAGYRTGYIGKWHLDGHGRSAYIPEERRQGFEFWQALECTHNYNDSTYYDNSDPTPRKWEGYGPMDQTRHAVQFMKEHREEPFLLFLSWGPPHAPYLTAPEEFHRLYDPGEFMLSPNVPDDVDAFYPIPKWREHSDKTGAERVRHLMAGYYAHCSALDACVGELQEALRDLGLEDDTIFVFTSDHGDMLGSHGLSKKQWPYDESACVPFLMKVPNLGKSGQVVDAPLNTPDIMPTLLDLCGIPVPPSVEGGSFVPALHGAPSPEDAALIVNIHPFGQWEAEAGGHEWRGVRTARYTYVRDLSGPWLLFDNRNDPYQQDNLINRPGLEEIQRALEAQLRRRLKETQDGFADGMEYVRRWGYEVNENGSVELER